MRENSLQEIFLYSPFSGELIRKKSPKKKVGYLKREYILVRVGGKQLPAHRIAWTMMYGEIPEDKVIDHIDGNGQNNSIFNLRLASNSQNLQNQRRAKNGSFTKLLGVSYYKRNNKFVASIVVNKKLKHLGYYTTPEEAHKVYLTAKRKYHEFCTI